MIYLEDSIDANQTLINDIEKEEQTPNESADSITPIESVQEIYVESSETIPETEFVVLTDATTLQQTETNISNDSGDTLIISPESNDNIYTEDPAISETLVSDVQENAQDVQENAQDVQENAQDVQENVQETNEHSIDDIYSILDHGITVNLQSESESESEPVSESQSETEFPIRNIDDHILELKTLESEFYNMQSEAYMAINENIVAGSKNQESFNFVLVGLLSAILGSVIAISLFKGFR